MVRNVADVLKYGEEKGRYEMVSNKVERWNNLEQRFLQYLWSSVVFYLFIFVLNF